MQSPRAGPGGCSAVPVTVDLVTRPVFRTLSEVVMLLPETASRRRALQSFGSLALLGLAPLTLGGCESLLEQIRNRPMRRSLRTMPANDPVIETYRAAVAAMKALPASDRRNWNAQAQIHFDHCPHGNWFFLPWHRAYLLYFEQICRELTGEKGFALPYWNWTCQRQIPAPFLGDASNALFVSGRSGVPPAALPDEVVGTALMEMILGEPNFNLFASDPAPTLRPSVGYGTLEATPHNSLHGFVGGVMGGFQSPRDPVFWMHHNMIERIWWEWNGVLGNANTNDTAWTQMSLAGMFCDRTGAVIDNITVGLLNLAPLLSYRFDNDPFTTCIRAVRPHVITDREALSRFLKDGARVELRRVGIVARAGDFEVPVGRTTTTQLSVKNVPNLAGVSRQGPRRLLLRVVPAEQPATGDFFVRVFIGMPEAGPDTPTDGPRHVGSFAFFNDPAAVGHHAHGGTSANAAFVVDVGAALERMRATGAALPETLGIQLVPVPMPGASPRSRTLRIRSLELQLADSVTPEPRPLGEGSRR
jgi:tyrosinase